jgi:hypothetical protein
MKHVRGRGEVHKRFLWRNLREIHHLQDPDVDGDNIKMDLLEVEWGGGMEWIGVAKDRNQ